MNKKNLKSLERKLANSKNAEVLSKDKLDKLKGGAGIEDAYQG